MSAYGELEKAAIAGLEARVAAVAEAARPGAPALARLSELVDRVTDETIAERVASGVTDAELPAYLAVTAGFEPLDPDEDLDDHPGLYNYTSDADLERKRILLELRPAVARRMRELYVGMTSERQEPYVLDVATRVRDLLASALDAGEFGRGQDSLSKRRLANDLGACVSEGDAPRAARLAFLAGQTLSKLPGDADRMTFTETDLSREVTYAVQWESAEGVVGRYRDREATPALVA